MLRIEVSHLDLRFERDSISGEGSTSRGHDLKVVDAAVCSTVLYSESQICRVNVNDIECALLATSLGYEVDSELVCIHASVVVACSKLDDECLSQDR